MFEATDIQVCPDICLGPGALSQLPQKLREASVQKAMIVTDKGLMDGGVAPKAISAIENERIAKAVFDRVVPDPPAALIHEAAEFFKAQNCDAIIAVGGGSSIDTAKAAGIVAANGGSIMDYEGVGKVTLPLPFLAAVPTTYGSGSEVTAFAIITDEARNFKAAIVGPNVIPRLAVVDPDMMMGLPHNLAASVVLDALSHAIESYVSRLAQPVAEGLALRAMQLIAQHIDRLIDDRNDKQAVLAAATASCMAGMAFSQTRLGLVHAMAHPFGTFFHVAHGVTCALLLPPVMEFNRTAVPQRFATIARMLSKNVAADDATAAAQSVDIVSDMVGAAGIPLRLGAFGVKSGDLPAMADDAMLSGNVKINPRASDREQIIQIFESCL